MKHLLSGVAVVAVLAIANPVWALNNTETQLAAAAMSDTTSATPPMHRHARTYRHAGHHGTAMHHSRANPDSMANSLNQQELSRLQIGGAMPPPSGPAPTSSGRLPGPKTSGSGYIAR